MLRIGLIRERKKLPDQRVALTPLQCGQLHDKYPDVRVVAERSPSRCYADDEYATLGIELTDDLRDCDVLLGIKEVPEDHLLHGKVYFFFSHTKKAQPYNRDMMRAIIDNEVRLVDYECLTYPDDQRILGFGFFAGVVGAHNGLMAYGRKHGLYELPRAYSLHDYDALIAAYEQVKLPPVKIVTTGSGKVAAGVRDVLTRLDIEPVEPVDFLTHEYEYPVYTHLNGAHLYTRKDNDLFHRDDFHAHPEAYRCLFGNYVHQADVLMNGIYWDRGIARLFEKEDIRRKDWRISVIADITCDVEGSVPINLASSTIADPVYGVDRATVVRTEPYQDSPGIIDVMAVDNLPNELPRDASQYFGAHLIKYIIPELLKDKSDILARATICENGRLTEKYEYLSDYAYSNLKKIALKIKGAL